MNSRHSASSSTLWWAWKATWLLLWLHPAPSSCFWWAETPSSTLGATWLKGGPCLLPQLLRPPVGQPLHHTAQFSAQRLGTSKEGMSGPVQSLIRAEQLNPKGQGFQGVLVLFRAVLDHVFWAHEKRWEAFGPQDVYFIDCKSLFLSPWPAACRTCPPADLKCVSEASMELAAGL